MTQFLTQSSPIPPYMAFPRFLLDKDGLNETAKFSIRFCSTEQGCPRKMTDGQMNKVMCSFSSPSRAWQKPCTRVKCLSKPH